MDFMIKLSGGPGSGVSGDNTKKIDMPLSEHVSVGTRKGLLDNMPYEEKEIKLSDITEVCQEKYVPVKLERMIENFEEIKDKAFDVLEVAKGKYTVLDGHHRFLAHREKGSETVKVRSYKKRKTASQEGSIKGLQEEMGKDKEDKLNSNTVERLARVVHNQWMDMAKGLMKEEKISPERAKRWKKLLVPYDKLSEEMKEKDRYYARLYHRAFMNHRKKKEASYRIELEVSDGAYEGFLEKFLNHLKSLGSMGCTRDFKFDDESYSFDGDGNHQIKDIKTEKIKEAGFPIKLANNNLSAERINNIAKSKTISQAELARQLGVSVVGLRDYMKKNDIKWRNVNGYKVKRKAVRNSSSTSIKKNPGYKNPKSNKVKPDFGGGYLNVR